MKMPSRTIPTGFVAVVAVLAGVALIANDRIIPFDLPTYGLFGNGVDALVYRAGGATVLDGESLYNHALLANLPFTYPPFAAIVFAPFALFSRTLTGLVVTAGNFALLYLVISMCFRQLGYAARVTVVSVLLAVAFTWLEPVRMTIWLGQINLALMCLVVWDLGRPQGSRLRGVGVGLAAGLKLTPAIYFAYLVFTRRRREAVVAACTVAATVAAGFIVVFSDAVGYWFGAVTDSTRIGLVSSQANQSLRGAMARWLDVPQPPLVLWLFCAGTVGILGLAIAAAAYSQRQPLLAVTLTGLTSAVVSPFSWGHHWVWVVPLMILAAHYAMALRRWYLWAVPVLIALPTLAWFKTYPQGVLAIGIFMIPGGPIRTQLMENAYLIMYAAVMASAGTVLTLRWRSGSSASTAEPEIVPNLKLWRRAA